MERLSQALEQYTQDTTGVANLRKEALKDYVLYDARVVNNSITHPNNFITIDKGEADGIRPEMGVVCGERYAPARGQKPVLQERRHYQDCHRLRQ